MNPLASGGHAMAALGGCGSRRVYRRRFGMWLTSKVSQWQCSKPPNSDTDRSLWSRLGMRQLPRLLLHRFRGFGLLGETLFGNRRVENLAGLFEARSGNPQPQAAIEHLDHASIDGSDVFVFEVRRDAR